jgi:glycosyltransferase involved in cell wall biosynthesis
MIGFDETLARPGPDAGDSPARHIGYVHALRERYPDGEIHAVVRVPRSSTGQPVDLAPGLRIHPVPSDRWSFTRRALPVLRSLGNAFDLVTTQTPFDDGLLGVWLRRRRGIPLNVQLHATFLDCREWIAERPRLYRAMSRIGTWVVHRADTIRVVCRSEIDRLERRFPRLAGRMVWLHSPTNVQIFEEPVRPEERLAVARELAGRGLEGAPFAVFTGRFVAQKNLPVLLRAFQHAGRRVPNAALALAGDGPLRGELQDLARTLGVDRRVAWLGSVPPAALRGWYGAASVTTLPSLYEGLPRTALESYLMSTPVIAGPFVSARELVVDGETGFVAPSFTDAAWLGERMADLLAEPARARAMGARGRAHVDGYLLSADAYLARLIDMWKRTARRSGRAAVAP